MDTLGSNCLPSSTSGPQTLDPRGNGTGALDCQLSSLAEVSKGHGVRRVEMGTDGFRALVFFVPRGGLGSATQQSLHLECCE